LWHRGGKCGEGELKRVQAREGPGRNGVTLC